MKEAAILSFQNGIATEALVRRDQDKTGYHLDAFPLHDTLLMLLNHS